MPKSTFSTKNVRNSGTQFPQLKLEQQGGYARIKLAEAEPTFEWVHRLQRPKLSPVDGRVLYKTIEVGKGENKETKEVPDLDFVGTPICLGNDDILEDRGVDPDHCPICKAAMDHPDMFDKPERKWAVHVFRYATKGNGTQPVEPIQFEVKVWRLSDNRYARVVSVLEEFAAQVDGDPLRVDLTLGPCNNVKFQNYEVQGSPVCALDKNPAKWAEAEETFRSNNAGDLSPYCGRKADPKYIRADIDEIKSKWMAANSGGAKVEEPDLSGTMSSSLLDTTPAVAAPAAAPAAPSVSLDQLDSTIGGSAETETEEEAPAAAPEAPAKQTASFSSLMDEIGLGTK